MLTKFSPPHRDLFFKSLIFFLALVFFTTSLGVQYIMPGAYASNLILPRPNQLINTTPSFDLPFLRGLKIYPDEPFKFDFILDEGNAAYNNKDLKTQSNSLIKYFLASLTIPESDFWVNLSPYEGDRIAPEELSRTDLGQDLLAQDYLLKQLVASLTYPDSPLGKQFWSKVYQRAYELFGTTKIPLNTFNKIWIVPDKVTIYEDEGKAIIGDAKLKVMLEEDYLSLKENISNPQFKTDTIANDKAEDINSFSSRIMKEVVVPVIENEVNTGKNFAPLRQVYYSLILATWFKLKLKQTVVAQIYADKKKTNSVNSDDPAMKEKIYRRYLEAFQKGIYNYVKRDLDLGTKRYVRRRYFSGGADMRTATATVSSGLVPFAKIISSPAATAASNGHLRSVETELKAGTIGNPIENTAPKPLSRKPNNILERSFVVLKNLRFSQLAGDNHKVKRLFSQVRLAGNILIDTEHKLFPHQNTAEFKNAVFKNLLDQNWAALHNQSPGRALLANPLFVAAMAYCAYTLDDAAGNREYQNKLDRYLSVLNLGPRQIEAIKTTARNQVVKAEQERVKKTIGQGRLSLPAKPANSKGEMRVAVGSSALSKAPVSASPLPSIVDSKPSLFKRVADAIVAAAPPKVTGRAWESSGTANLAVAVDGYTIQARVDVDNKTGEPLVSAGRIHDIAKEVLYMTSTDSQAISAGALPATITIRVAPVKDSIFPVQHTPGVITINRAIVERIRNPRLREIFIEASIFHGLSRELGVDAQTLARTDAACLIGLAKSQHESSEVNISRAELETNLRRISRINKSAAADALLFSALKGYPVNTIDMDPKMGPGSMADYQKALRGHAANFRSLLRTGQSADKSAKINEALKRFGEFCRLKELWSRNSFSPEEATLVEAVEQERQKAWKAIEKEFNDQGYHVYGKFMDSGRKEDRLFVLQHIEERRALPEDFGRQEVWFVRQETELPGGRVPGGAGFTELFSGDGSAIRVDRSSIERTDDQLIAPYRETRGAHVSEVDDRLGAFAVSYGQLAHVYAQTGQVQRLQDQEEEVFFREALQSILERGIGKDNLDKLRGKNLRDGEDDFKRLQRLGEKLVHLATMEKSGNPLAVFLAEIRRGFDQRIIIDDNGEIDRVPSEAILTALAQQASGQDSVAGTEAGKTMCRDWFSFLAESQSSQEEYNHRLTSLITQELGQVRQAFIAECSKHDFSSRWEIVFDQFMATPTANLLNVASSALTKAPAVASPVRAWLTKRSASVRAKLTSFGVRLGDTRDSLSRRLAPFRLRLGAARDSASRRITSFRARLASLRTSLKSGFVSARDYASNRVTSASNKLTGLTLRAYIAQDSTRRQINAFGERVASRSRAKFVSLGKRLASRSREKFTSLRLKIQGEPAAQGNPRRLKQLQALSMWSLNTAVHAAAKKAEFDPDEQLPIAMGVFFIGWVLTHPEQALKTLFSKRIEPGTARDSVSGRVASIRETLASLKAGIGSLFSLILVDMGSAIVGNPTRAGVNNDVGAPVGELSMLAAETSSEVSSAVVEAKGLESTPIFGTNNVAVIASPVLASSAAGEVREIEIKTLFSPNTSDGTAALSLENIADMWKRESQRGLPLRFRLNGASLMGNTTELLLTRAKQASQRKELRPLVRIILRVAARKDPQLLLFRAIQAHNEKSDPFARLILEAVAQEDKGLLLSRAIQAHDEKTDPLARLILEVAAQKDPQLLLTRAKDASRDGFFPLAILILEVLKDKNQDEPDYPYHAAYAYWHRDAPSGRIEKIDFLQNAQKNFRIAGRLYRKLYESERSGKNEHKVQLGHCAGEFKNIQKDIDRIKSQLMESESEESEQWVMMKDAYEDLIWTENISKEHTPGRVVSEAMVGQLQDLLAALDRSTLQPVIIAFAATFNLLPENASDGTQMFDEKHIKAIEDSIADPKSSWETLSRKYQVGGLSTRHNGVAEEAFERIKETIVKARKSALSIESGALQDDGEALLSGSFGRDNGAGSLDSAIDDLFGSGGIFGGDEAITPAQEPDSLVVLPLADGQTSSNAANHREIMLTWEKQRRQASASPALASSTALPVESIVDSLKRIFVNGHAAIHGENIGQSLASAFRASLDAATFNSFVPMAVAWGTSFIASLVSVRQQRRFDSWVSEIERSREAVSNVPDVGHELSLDDITIIGGHSTSESTSVEQGVAASPAPVMHLFENSSIKVELEISAGNVDVLQGLAEAVSIGYKEALFRENGGLIVGRLEGNVYTVTGLIPLVRSIRTDASITFDKEEIRERIEGLLPNVMVLGLYHNHGYHRSFSANYKPGPSQDDAIIDDLNIEELKHRIVANRLGLIVEAAPQLSFEALVASEGEPVKPSMSDVGVYGYITPNRGEDGKIRQPINENGVPIDAINRFFADNRKKPGTVSSPSGIKTPGGIDLGGDKMKMQIIDQRPKTVDQRQEIQGAASAMAIKGLPFDINKFEGFTFNIIKIEKVKSLAAMLK